MGNCCSTISKKKKSNNRDVFDPDYECSDQQMMSGANNNNNSNVKEGAVKESFNVNTVKRALDNQHVPDLSEYDYDNYNYDDDSDITEESPLPAQPQPHNGVGVSLESKLRKSVERLGSTGNMKVFPKFKKPLSAIPQHMLREGFSRQKHNSTSSLYINSTISQPDNEELLRCMATAILYHIEKGAMSTHKTYYDIFSEEKYPIMKSRVDTKKIPDVEAIYQFLNTIFKAERLDSECAIMCLAYTERIIALTGLTMDPTNWRRLVLSALILASKVWEDQSVWNVDFLPVFDNLTAQDLNKLERQFLALLQYNVSLTASLYAKYYFELRQFSKLNAEHFPLQPLDKLNAKRLEDHSQASEYRVKTFKRSASVDQLQPVRFHIPAVLN
jgi:hypothetical protein